MKTLKLLVPSAILMTGVLFTSTASFAKPEYAKKEKKGCVTCHVTAKSKDLNAVGKCYKDSKSLEGCEAKK
jgi:cytochrome c551/c552